MALRSWVFDEPLDAIIYMVTAALGFSSIENALFLWGALPQGAFARRSDRRFAVCGRDTPPYALFGDHRRRYRAVVLQNRGAARALCGVSELSLPSHCTLSLTFLYWEAAVAATFFIFLCIWFGIVAILLLVERVK